MLGVTDKEARAATHNFNALNSTEQKRNDGMTCIRLARAVSCRKHAQEGGAGAAQQQEEEQLKSHLPLSGEIIIVQTRKDECKAMARESDHSEPRQELEAMRLEG